MITSCETNYGAFRLAYAEDNEDGPGALYAEYDRRRRAVGIEPGEPLWVFQGKTPGAGLAHWRQGRRLWTNVEQDGRNFSRCSPPFIVLDSLDIEVGFDGGF